VRVSALRPTPPASGTFSSAVPWIWITDTGSRGMQGVAITTPDTTPTAAKMSLASQASLYAIMAPLE
jgi:hypothetical protein